MNEEFESVRIFNSLKDKLLELPIYDQLDWLIIFFTTPNNKDGVSVWDVAFFISNMPPSHEDKTEDVINQSRWLIEQLQRDKYITGDNAMVIHEKNKDYKPTLKSFLAKEGIGGYRMSIYKQRTEERAIASIREHEKRTNKRLTRIGIFAVIFAGGSTYYAATNYYLQVKIQTENNQSISLQQKIRAIDSLIRKKDQSLILQEKTIDSLKKHFYGKKKP